MSIIGPKEPNAHERRVMKKVEALARKTGYFVPPIRWRRCAKILSDTPRGDHAETVTRLMVLGKGRKRLSEVTVWISDRAVEDTVLVDACVHEVAHAITAQMVDATVWGDGHIASWGVVYASLIRNLDAGPPIE